MKAKATPTSLRDLAALVGADGPVRDMQIQGAATLRHAGRDEISFLANARYKGDLDSTRAGAVLIHGRHAEYVPEGCVALVCDDPYLAFAKVMNRLYPISVTPGIHPTAVIDPEAEIADDCEIGAYVVVGAQSRIGAGCKIYPHVTIYHNVALGDRCIVHSGSVIGGDGFGFAPGPEGAVKIPQVGGVHIGHDVEIGAGCTIDRGALDDTRIGNGVKLDNQIQVGHNVEIGDHTVIAGQTALAGSCRIGKGCMIGGQVAVSGHVSVGDGCRVAGRSGVMRDVPGGSTVAGLPTQPHKQWLRTMAALPDLPEMAKTWRKQNPDAG